jgi:transcriptional regulator with XRE-family HTH domain
MDVIALSSDHFATMAKRRSDQVITRLKPDVPRPNFIRHWRKFRQLTQEKLADRVGMSTASISQIESGKQGWTDATLYALADALRCEAGDLLMRNPLDTEAPWSLWARLKPDDRKKAIVILKTLAGDEQAAA